MAVTGALLAGPGLLAMPAQAAGHTAHLSAAAASTRGEFQVNAFFAAYRDAIRGESADGKTPAEVRAVYLTSELDAKLTDWASKHDADPVFRAQNVPSGWTVRAGVDTAESFSVIVTETYDGGTSQEVLYTVRASDLVITDLQDPTPAA
ncbi:hypothetical protein ACIBEA_44185 [Streptomyces sp. NPDC051555]|uniref:hypothetical protein n=1 Tax=Streptomyces sp. NPDC051555 TaxID=3365657 RepID=UPI00379498A1